jgi:hypothetical protein
MTDLSFMTLQNLEAFLKAQPPDQSYNYRAPIQCPLTLFMKSHEVDAIAGVIYIYIDKLYDMPEHFNSIVKGRNVQESWTYGKALRRCRDAIKSVSPSDTDTVVESINDAVEATTEEGEQVAETTV